MVTYHYTEVKNLNIFYRKGGNPNNPVIVLFHGFPSASHYFRELMPILEKDHYVIAPDFPDFDNSDCPSRDEFTYTFDNISNVMEAFIEN